jgi:hypothetical protein
MRRVTQLVKLVELRIKGVGDPEFKKKTNITL